MASVFAPTNELPPNPLDVVEQILSAHEWPFERFNSEEISANVDGQWCHYHLWFNWLPDSAAVQFTCTFNIVVPEAKRGGIQELLALINGRLWLGHFTLWSDDGTLMFRHAQLMGGAAATSTQFEDLVGVALCECERFYPTFQYVIWGGKSPTDAIASAMLDTVGEA